MKQTIKMLLISLLLTSCRRDIERGATVDEVISYSKFKSVYTLVAIDGDQTSVSFLDSIGKFKVGDTVFLTTKR